MTEFKARLAKWSGLALVLGALSPVPAQARDIKVPSPAICAAMYYSFAGPQHDDPAYLAMQNKARASGFYGGLSQAQATAEDRKLAIYIANMPESTGPDGGISQVFIDNFHACIFGYMIRPPASIITDLYGEAEFEQQWAAATTEQRRKAEAERQQSAAQANNSERDKAYAGANSTLSQCMRMPSSVDPFNRDYAAYRKATWDCEDIRAQAIKMAESDGNSAAAQEYRSIRFPWQ